MIFKTIKKHGCPKVEVLAINEAGDMLKGYIYVGSSMTITENTPEGSIEKSHSNYWCTNIDNELGCVVAYIPITELKMLWDLQKSIPE